MKRKIIEDGQRGLPRASGGLNLRVSRGLQRAFDPQGVLNPGKRFDL